MIERTPPLLSNDELRRRLRERFAWRGENASADMAAWWLDADVLRSVGPALADLHREADPQVVVGIQSRGYLLGPLAAVSLGVGFVEVQRDLAEDETGARVLLRTTPPDYAGRSIALGVEREALSLGTRTLLVDDWIETGAQADAARRLVEHSGAKWLGAAVVIDAASHPTRRNLNVRSLLRVGDLG